MYDKFLFVGLGGSGGSTLGHLKQELFGWLKEHGVEPKIPSGWQFLHIDTPVVPDSSPPMEEDEYLGLIPQGVGFAGIQAMLDGDTSLSEEMQTWRVDPAGNPVPIALGAGQFRAIGSTVAAAYAEKIKRGLERKIALMKREGANSEIAEVYSKAAKKRPRTKNRVHVIVVSSMAGGTGAGILTMVCDVLRATDEEGTGDILGILYTPDVFSTLPPGQTKGVQPNSLAALSELCNGYWWNGSSTDIAGSYLVPPKQSLLLQRAGLPHPGPRSGPSYPFLVGRESTGGIDHGTPQGLFSMVGRALLGWVTDTTVQTSFLREDIGNWHMAAMGNETGGASLFNAGDEKERGYPNISSLGFARVTTGTDYFREYAARRIVREALIHINRFHHGSLLAIRLSDEHGTNNPKDLAGLIADMAHKTFMQSCKLSELGDVENNILDALTPTNDQDLKTEFETKALEFSQLGSDQTRSSEDWREKVLAAVEDSLPIYEASYTEALGARSLEWLAEIEESVVKEVEKSIATFGLMVTQESCKKAAHELRSAISEELHSVDYSDLLQWSNEWKDEVDTKLVGITGRLRASDSRLKTALLEGVHWAAYRGKALVAKRASLMAVQVAEHLLEPVANALEEAIDEAEAGQTEAGEWPAWSDAEPPDSVQPPKGVYALEKPDDYNKMFMHLLSDSTPPDLETTTKDWIREIVITGAFLREQHEAHVLEDPEEVLCVSVKEHEPGRAHWYPETQGSFGELRNPRSLPVTINTDIRSLEKRALAWLNLPGSPFANFLDQSLRSYLGSTNELDGGRVSAAQYAARRVAFVAAFTDAVRGGRPLINLDQDLLGNIHPNPPADKVIVSQLPFSGHVMKDEIRPVLAPVTGLPEGQIDKLFSTDDKIKHVDITTTLGAPHSVMVIESLMRPIVSDWGRAKARQETQAFWFLRRARTIGEFVPAPQALIYCLVRGWFTGVLLGRIDRIPDGSSAVTISQEASEGRRGRTVKFPYPYLSRGAGVRDRLPQVLEALCLALVDVGLKGTVDPLAAYCVLRDLGRSEPGSSLYLYPELHPALKRWVDSGTVRAGNTDPLLQADENATPADRGRILVELLERQLVDYRELYAEEQHRWEMSPIAISGPPLWTGINTYIFRELDNLHGAAVSYEGAVREGNQVL